MGTPNPTKMERGRCAMPVGMSAVAVLLSMALVLSMSLPSEAAGSSTAGLPQWGAGLQTRIRAGERRLLSNHTNYTKFKEAVASTAGAAIADVSLKITEVRRRAGK